MKTLISLFIAASLFAQEAPKAPPPAPVLSQPMSKSTIVLDPKARTSDLIQAFDQLRKDKPTLKIMVRTVGATLSGVTDMSATTGGTILLIKVLSNQGVRIQVVPVEDVMEIGYLP